MKLKAFNTIEVETWEEFLEKLPTLEHLDQLVIAKDLAKILTPKNRQKQTVTYLQKLSAQQILAEQMWEILFSEMVFRYQMQKRRLPLALLRKGEEIVNEIIKSGQIGEGWMARMELRYVLRDSRLKSETLENILALFTKATERDSALVGELVWMILNNETAFDSKRGRELILQHLGEVIQTPAGEDGMSMFIHRIKFEDAAEALCWVKKITTLESKTASVTTWLLKMTKFCELGAPASEWVYRWTKKMEEGITKNQLLINLATYQKIRLREVIQIYQKVNLDGLERRAIQERVSRHPELILWIKEKGLSFLGLSEEDKRAGVLVLLAKKILKGEIKIKNLSYQEVN